MATLRSVSRRISLIVSDHLQIRSFFQNVEADEWLNDKDTLFPAALLLDNGGVISPGGHATTLSFRLFLVDVVNVSEGTKLNELDVQSDMLGVAQDIVAQVNRSGCNDWFPGGDSVFQELADGDNVLYAGVVVDFSVRIVFTQNICAIPTSFTDCIPQNSTDMNVYDLEYIGLGTEGSSLVIPALAGKNILLITRESGALYKIASLPDTAEYTWDGTTITFGLPIALNARFLILYRNY